MSYKIDETPLSGQQYRRCNQIVIDNRLGQAPTITFHQETVIGLAGGQVMHAPMQPQILAFDPSHEIAIINPETGADTGDTITQAEIYALVYSAFVASIAPPPLEEI